MKCRHDEEAYAREVLEAFASRAFRRPARAEEVDRLVAGFNRTRPSKERFEDAIKVPLIAVLCSPNFLFLTEPSRSLTLRVEHSDAAKLDAESQATLTEYELASRLSYFLWSTMPDDELLQLARDGKLRAKGVIDQQVQRMLKFHVNARSHDDLRNFMGTMFDLIFLAFQTDTTRVCTFQIHPETFKDKPTSPPLTNLFNTMLQHLEVPAKPFANSTGQISEFSA